MERIDSRQAGFLAAPALTRRKQKMEKERVQRLREAGCSDPESYVPLDWAEPVGGDVHEIPELRAVGTDVASSTAQQSGSSLLADEPGDSSRLADVQQQQAEALATAAAAAELEAEAVLEEAAQANADAPAAAVEAEEAAQSEVASASARLKSRHASHRAPCGALGFVEA